MIREKKENINNLTIIGAMTHKEILGYIVIRGWVG
jgi:hypothetical protein